MKDPILTVHLDLDNPTDEPQTVFLEKGRCFEILDPDQKLQNAVLANDHVITIPPHGTVSLDLPAHCLNRYRSMTLGHNAATITPFLYTESCDDQESIWTRMAYPLAMN